MQKKSQSKEAERGSRSRSQRTSKSNIRPAGRGDPRQQAGGPEHRGADAHEDRNP